MPRLVLMLLFTVLSACRGEVQPYIAGRVAPKWGYTCLKMGDGACLPYRLWASQEHAEPEAVLIALHGLNDYSRAFEPAAEMLADRGIWVLAYDQRGFGATCSRGIWPGTENLVEDAGEVLALTNARYPNVPVYIMGESMGGAVAVVASRRGKLETAAGLVLIAPALWGGDDMSKTYRRVLAVFMATAPRLSFSGRGLGKRASDNLAMLGDLGRDPVFLKSTRVDVINGLIELMDEAHEVFPAISKPTLLLYGKRDQIVPVNVFDKLAKSSPAGVRVIAYPTGWHMLLRDTQAALPVEDIAAWVIPPGTERKH